MINHRQNRKVWSQMGKGKRAKTKTHKTHEDGGEAAVAVGASSNNHGARGLWRDDAHPCRGCWCCCRCFKLHGNMPPWHLLQQRHLHRLPRWDVSAKLPLAHQLSCMRWGCGQQPQGMRSVHALPCWRVPCCSQHPDFRHRVSLLPAWRVPRRHRALSFHLQSNDHLPGNH